MKKMCVFVFLILTLVKAQLTGGAERIVGGTETTIQNYPFAAAILVTNDHGTFTQTCGGSVLNNRSILTAAHCINPIVLHLYRVRLGSSSVSIGGQVYNLVRAIIHPDYNVFSPLDSDIALLHTATPIIYIPSLVAQGAIAGSNYNVPDGAPVLAIGWGFTSSGIDATASERLQHVQVYKINDDTCRQRWGRQFTDNMMCAGVLDVGGRGPCGRDSGGPVLHNNVIVGVISFGDGESCVSGFRPGVKVRVSRFTSWIQANA